MDVPSEVVEAADASGFSGIAASDGESPGDRWTLVRGLADRAHGVPVALATRFGIASGSKAFTALTVIALVSDGRLSLDKPAREVLGSDRPLIDDAAPAPHARNAGVRTQLLGAVRRAVPAGLPMVAETHQDAVGCYAANNFAVTSLGEKYPGVERFRVHLRALANPEPDS